MFCLFLLAQNLILKVKYLFLIEASRGVGHKLVTVKGDNRPVVSSISSRGNEIFNSFISSLWCRGWGKEALLALFPSGKWATECLITMYPLPTLLCAGYSVKLKKNHVSSYATNLNTIFINWQNYSRTRSYTGSVSVPYMGSAYRITYFTPILKLIQIPQQFKHRIFFIFHDVYPYLCFVWRSYA